jgi:hypothetical protein
MNFGDMLRKALDDHLKKMAKRIDESDSSEKRTPDPADPGNSYRGAVSSRNYVTMSGN